VPKTDLEIPERCNSEEGYDRSNETQQIKVAAGKVSERNEESTTAECQHPEGEFDKEEERKKISPPAVACFAEKVAEMTGPEVIRKLQDRVGEIKGKGDRKPRRPETKEKLG
jgi:hypothetical protein